MVIAFFLLTLAKADTTGLGKIKQKQEQDNQTHYPFSPKYIM